MRFAIIFSFGLLFPFATLMSQQLENLPISKCCCDFAVDTLNIELRDSILVLHKKDQNNITHNKGVVKEQSPPVLLDKLISQYGFPTSKSLKNGRAEIGLIFLLLHASEEVMTKYYDCVLKYEFHPQFEAMYIDKLSIYKTGKQIYGTQNNNMGELFPFVYPTKIDSLRKIFNLDKFQAK